MEVKHFECIVDGHHGQYTPQVFAELFPDWLDDDEKDILLSGPEHPHYWDVWSDIQGRECWDGDIWQGDIWQGESGDIFILSDSPMQALITAWVSSEELDSSAAELREIVQKLAYDFLTDRDEFISEEEALDYFKPSQYNDSLVKKALEWMRKELAEARNG